MDKKKAGRKPKQETARNQSLHIRLTADEKRMLQEEAKKKGLTVTDLILQSIK